MTPQEIVILIVAVLILFWMIIITIKVYNNLVIKDTDIQIQQGQINTALQKREDLVAQLSVLTKEASIFEKATQTDSARLRNGGKTMAGLVATSENYPQLNSIMANFSFFQEQIAGIETVLRHERISYNTLVGDYKQYVRSFPTFIIAYPLGYNANRYQIFSTHAFDKPKFWEQEKL